MFTVVRPACNWGKKHHRQRNEKQTKVEYYFFIRSKLNVVIITSDWERIEARRASILPVTIGEYFHRFTVSFTVVLIVRNYARKYIKLYFSIIWLHHNYRIESKYTNEYIVCLYSIRDNLKYFHICSLFSTIIFNNQRCKRIIKINKNQSKRSDILSRFTLGDGEKRFVRQAKQTREGWNASQTSRTINFLNNS